MQMGMRGRGTLGSLERNIRFKRRQPEKNGLDFSRETLVPLRIAILETNLQFDGLDKVSLAPVGGISKESLDRAPHT
jgi:hypothetical protein